MLLDLSAVTDGLIQLVESEWEKAPIWKEVGGAHAGEPAFVPTVTGAAPDAVRDGEGTQLSIFLYHVESDNAQESRFWNPQLVSGPEEPVSYMPFALNLFYIVSAYSSAEKGYTEEQEAMSVALRIFHDNAVIRSDTSTNPAWNLTLTMEHRSYDELSRLWQATTVPLRLSAVYRAAVVFLGLEEPAKTAPEVKELKGIVGVEGVLADGKQPQPDEFVQTEGELEPVGPGEP
jgi:hypothetical protein